MSENIVEQAKLAWNRKLSYFNLQEQFQDQLVFAHSSGMWRADRETIAFLSAFADIDHITAEDIYGVPRQIKPAELLDLCKQKYQFAANAWAVEYANLSKVRRSSDV